MYQYMCMYQTLHVHHQQWQEHNAAPVIYNHGPTQPGAGWGIAGEMSHVFTLALSSQCWANVEAGGFGFFKQKQLWKKNLPVKQQ